jgi:hypothetical protein
MGIEAMFKDCKTGGYNLEGSQANTQRLTNLILLIAIAYTTSVLKEKSIKNSRHQKYIARLTAWASAVASIFESLPEYCGHPLHALVR